MSTAFIATLQKAFPELNILVTGKVNHPHAMAAVTRNCSEAFILRLIGYEKNIRCLKEGKIFLVDVGANFVRHVKNQRFNIHCCVLLIDIRDSARQTEREAEMLNMVAKKVISEKTCDDYTLVISVVLCEVRIVM